ncbi:hypothetical protein ACIBKX_12865 [Streptomyces sp. NPDC050658]|uniref:hypothetical protein n=1 Tax=unclassified Streptomyces TaxID=2593676 RepID=UPI00343F16FE
MTNSRDHLEAQALRWLREASTPPETSHAPASREPQPQPHLNEWPGPDHMNDLGSRPGQTSQPTGLIDPVLAVRRLSRYEIPGRRYLGRADCALVVAGADDAYETYLPPRRPLSLRGRTAVYEVDLGVHPLRLRTRLPSEIDTFEFDTTFDLTWQVTDPESFVVSQERDIPALLNRVLHRLLRPVTRGFAISSSAAAEATVQQVLDSSGDHVSRQGVRFGGTVRLRRDPDARAQQGRLRAAEYNAAAAWSEHEVERLRLEQQQQLQAQKIEFYRHHLAKGGLDALLLHLSEHAQDTHLVVENLRADEKRTIENQLELIDRVLPDETLEKYQREEPQQLVLALFRSIFTQAMGDPAFARQENPPAKATSISVEHPDSPAASA